MTEKSAIVSDTSSKSSSSSASASQAGSNAKEVQLAALNSPEGKECLKEFFSAQFELNHDLNNPLAGVVGYLELAMTDEDQFPERAVQLLKNAQKCADRMDEMIQEFVKSKRKLQETVDLSEVVVDDH